MTADVFKDAHRHCVRHRAEVLTSAVCSCFFCYAQFPPSAIQEWTDFDAEDDLGETAICPQCGVDAVLGERSGYPVTERAFLEGMHARWFSSRDEA